MIMLVLVRVNETLQPCSLSMHWNRVPKKTCLCSYQGSSGVWFVFFLLDVAGLQREWEGAGTGRGSCPGVRGTQLEVLHSDAGFHLLFLLIIPTSAHVGTWEDEMALVYGQDLWVYFKDLSWKTSLEH